MVIVNDVSELFIVVQRCIVLSVFLDQIYPETEGSGYAKVEKLIVTGTDVELSTISDGGNLWNGDFRGGPEKIEVNSIKAKL